VNQTAKNFWVNVSAAVFLMAVIGLLKRFKLKKNTKNKMADTNEDFINTLHPAIRDKVRELLRRWKSEGYEVKITSGYRSFNEQQKIYDKGRTVKSDTGVTSQKPLGSIVTNSKPGDSFHNYGLAIDVIPIVNGKHTYNFDFKKLSYAAKLLGFKWGGDFKRIKDNPHFEYTFGKTLAQVKKLRTGNNDYINIT